MCYKINVHVANGNISPFPPPSSNGMSFKGRLSVPCGQVIQISGSTVEFGRTGADQVCTLSPVHQVPKQHY